MSQIRAFIGHSFDEKDREVVQKFLEIFSEISQMEIGFSWDHAKPAESKDLASKVLEKIEGKNLFIGICTKKEYVVDLGAFKAPFFRRGQWSASQSEINVKTSDWIIQEIGLAIGRGLKLMILKESGLKEPGGLQGNHEFIEFERDNPQAAFTKILQTIRSMRPSGSTQGVESSAEMATNEKETESASAGSSREPEEDWSSDEYEMELLGRLIRGDEAGVKSIDESIRNNEKVYRKGDWESTVELFRVLVKQEESLERLENLADRFPGRCEVYRNIAAGFRAVAEYEKEISYLNDALEVAEDKAMKLDILASLAIAFDKVDRGIEADKAIAEARTLAGEDESEIGELAKDLLAVKSERGEVDAVVGLQEYILSQHPDEDDRRFSLAYKYSELSLYDACLFHYLKISEKRRGGVEWNNIGVAYERLGLPYRSISAYRESEAEGYTLAMANMAYRFKEQGFLKEAKDLCEKGKSFEDYHNNINRALVEINEVPENETKRAVKLGESADNLSRFYRRYGAGIAMSNCEKWPKRWKGPDCELEIWLDAGRLNLIGHFYRKSVGLFSIADYKSGQERGKEKVEHWRVHYQGVMDGRGVKGFVRRRRVREDEGSWERLGEDDSDCTVLMVLNDDEGEMSVCENVGQNSGKRRFYSLKAIAP